VISIWIDVLSDSIEPESCILRRTNSTSASGWLRKTNFADSKEEKVQMTTARLLVNLVINSKCCLYSQRFPGDENVVADALSRDFYLSNTDLSNLIIFLFPSQVPFGLSIQDLPTEISSWLTCLLLNHLSKEQWSKAPTRSKLLHGTDTNPTYCPLDVTGTLSLYNSQFNDIKKLAAYAHKIREGRFCSNSSQQVKSESVRASLDHVAQAFKLANRPDPRLDSDGKFAFFLQ